MIFQVASLHIWRSPKGATHPKPSNPPSMLSTEPRKYTSLITSGTRKQKVQRQNFYGRLGISPLNQKQAAGFHLVPVQRLFISWNQSLLCSSSKLNAMLIRGDDLMQSGAGRAEHLVVVSSGGSVMGKIKRTEGSLGRSRRVRDFILFSAMHSFIDAVIWIHILFCKDSPEAKRTNPYWRP